MNTETIEHEKVYWRVYWRWTIWYGVPEKVICVWSTDEENKGRYDAGHVFEKHDEAVKCADAHKRAGTMPPDFSAS